MTAAARIQDDENRMSVRVGKKKAGRILDGLAWYVMPEAAK